MSDSATFECQLGTSDPSCPLGITILLDGNVIYDNKHLTETVTFKKTFSGDDADHLIEFVMSGKLPEHTKIDADGKIIKDVLLNISNIQLDEIDVGQLIAKKTTYTHSHNDNGPATSQPFYGVMGCNGTVSFKFSTPVYIWLLENM